MCGTAAPHLGPEILSFQFTNIVNSAAMATWSSVTARLRAAVQDMYYRDLSVDMRIQYVHDWVCNIDFPPPTDCIRQINTTISPFIWRGEISRVPLSTLQRGKTEGGWNLVHPWAKSIVLFMSRLQVQSQRFGSFTAGWLGYWNINPGLKNPTYPDVPATMGYLRTYLTDTA